MIIGDVLIVAVFPIFHRLQRNIRIILVDNECFPIICFYWRTITAAGIPINTVFSGKNSVFNCLIVVILDFLNTIPISFRIPVHCNTGRQSGKRGFPSVICPACLIFSVQRNFYYACTAIVRIAFKQIGIAGFFQDFPFAIIFLILYLESNAGWSIIGRIFMIVPIFSYKN